MRAKIHLFGDSITESSFGEGEWGATLTNLFSRTLDVVLRGYSGYNTRWALRVCPNIFPSVDESTLAVTLFFGANDACLPDRYSSFQHVPLLEYKENLGSLIAFFKKRFPKALILLITPPPVDEEARLRFPYIENLSNLPERTNEAAGEYARACVEVAKENACPVVDLWGKMQEFNGWKKEYLSDGLHLTRAGGRVVFQEVVSKFAENGLRVEDLPVDLPLIEEIDVNDPLHSFPS